MRQTVYLNEHQGDDKNHGLSSTKPVRTWKRASQISRREGAQAIKIIGSNLYLGRIKLTLPLPRIWVKPSFPQLTQPFMFAEIESSSHSSLSI